VLALRCPRSDGSEQFVWRAGIDVAEWGKTAEAWLPANATLNSLTPAAVLPDSLPGLWPKDDSGVKLSDMYKWFDGTHSYQEQTEPGYPAEARPIPKVDFNLVKKAVAKAVEGGALWLVFGNDSVLGETPTDLQLDPDASLHRPPEQLKAIEFLPSSLPGAWSNDAEPTATVAGIYAEIKAKNGRPWPAKQFLDMLNAAIGQGFMRRANGSGPISSLQHDGDVELIIKAEAPKPIEPTPIVPGRRASTLALLNAAEVQDFADQIHVLTKSLAGSDLQIEVRVSVKEKSGANLEEASAVLHGVKTGWRF
jgi:hypothetical protein